MEVVFSKAVGGRLDSLICLKGTLLQPLLNIIKFIYKVLNINNNWPSFRVFSSPMVLNNEFSLSY